MIDKMISKIFKMILMVMMCYIFLDILISNNIITLILGVLILLLLKNFYNTKF